MKQLVIVLVLLFSVLSVKSQLFLGEDEKTVREKIESLSPGTIITKSPVKDVSGYFILDWKSILGESFVSFSSEGISFLYMIMPKTTSDLNYLIKYNNDNFLIVSDTEWKLYKSGKIFKIVLSYSNLYSSYVFSHSLVK